MFGTEQKQKVHILGEIFYFTKEILFDHRVYLAYSQLLKKCHLNIRIPISGLLVLSCS